MSQQLHQLKRLERLRAASERLHQAVYARAQQAASTAQAERHANLQQRDATVDASHHSLSGGNWTEWWMGESTLALIDRHREHIEQICDQREQQVEASQSALSRAHRGHEQAKLLLELARERARYAEERRSQATSDDRFAARAHWLQQQERVKES